MKKFLPLLALLGLSFFLTDCKTIMGKKTSPPSTTRARSGDLGVSTYSTTSTSDLQRGYVDNFSTAAVAEMQRTGIPASITLAQGILESGAGQSLLAKEANNHFGIKCGNNWTGPTYRKKDDDRDGSGNLIESCFRKYKDPAESFYDHSEFIRDPKKANRYGFLFNLDRRDYQGWAKGLQSAGYATSGTYAAQLISLIERYQLNLYDDPGTAPTPSPTPPTAGSGNPPAGGNQGNTGGNQGNPSTPGGGITLPPMERIRYINDTKVVSSQPGETLQDIARMYSLSVEKVQTYNDNGYPISQKLTPGSNVFIQHKYDRYRGRTTSHYMKADQTMFDVAQVYGIRLDGLLQRNNLVRGEEPVTGEKILLRGKRAPGEKPRLRDVSTPPTNTTSPPLTTNPGTTKPGDTTPTPVSGNGGNMTPDNDELFEIGGDEPKPAPQPVPTPQQPTQPTVPPPATSGTPYPGEPVKPPATTWPGSGTTPSKPTTTTTPGQPGTYYVVEKGETLFRVSQKFNTTVANLKKLNNLTSDYIQAGQRLRVN